MILVTLGSIENHESLVRHGPHANAPYNQFLHFAMGMHPRWPFPR